MEMVKERSQRTLKKNRLRRCDKLYLNINLGYSLLPTKLLSFFHYYEVILYIPISV